MKKSKLYFLDVSNGNLYELPLRKVNHFLSLYPNWVELDADNSRIYEIREYFKMNGKILASPTQLNLLATYV
jgi:hypothetical protein